MKYENELKDAITVAKKAIETIMDFYRNHFEIEIKSDNSPVTDADKASNELIYDYLKQRYPSYAFLTEEMSDDLSRLNNDYVWIIDPLDGTEDFIRRDDQFCINIALVYAHQPVVGVVAIPVTGEIYFAVATEGSYYLPAGSTQPVRIHVNAKTSDLIQLSSVHHQTVEEIAIFEKHRDRIQCLSKVGSAIKACLIARGEAEVSFRYGSGSKEWDTCAPQLVLTEAGGVYTTSKLKPILYNKEDVYNHDGFFMLNRLENSDLVD